MEPVGVSSLICWAVGVDGDGRGGVGASMPPMRNDPRVNDNGGKMEDGGTCKAVGYVGCIL